MLLASFDMKASFAGTGTDYYVDKVDRPGSGVALSPTAVANVRTGGWRSCISRCVGFFIRKLATSTLPARECVDQRNGGFFTLASRSIPEGTDIPF